MSEALARVARTVAEADAGDLAGFARPLLDLLGQFTGLESTYLTVIEHGGSHQRVRVAINRGELRIAEGVAVEWEHSLCRRALEQDQAFADDVPQRWPEVTVAAELGITTFLTSPVRAADGRLLGTLCAASRERRPLPAEAHDALRLFSRVLGQQLEREHLLAELREANATLQRQASLDALTELPNRRALREAVAARLRDRAGDRRVHLAFVDLDGFKRVNDQHGHEAGDHVLRAIASRLAAALRPGDLVGRYGGDEFVVLIEAPADEPEAGERLRERLEAATRGRIVCGGVAIDYPGASVGVAGALPGDADIDALVARADAAMYARKRERQRGA